MRTIDNEKLLKNVTDMINLLEYDSMRSSGKAKINAANLRDLIELQKHYTAKINSSKQPVAAKVVAKKKEAK